MNNVKFTGLIFFLYLTVFLWLKAINELSFNSIEHFASLGELLALVILSGVIFYTCYFLNKRFFTESEKEDIFSTKFYTLNLNRKVRFFIAVLASIFVGIIVTLKTVLWGNYSFLIVFAASLLTFLAMYYSLSKD